MALNLSALQQIKPVTLPDPREGIMNLAALKSQMLGDQLKGVQLQGAQAELQSNQLQAEQAQQIRQIVAKHNGDIESALPEINQINPSAGAQMAKASQDVKNLQSEQTVREGTLNETTRHNLADENNARATTAFNQMQAQLNLKKDTKEINGHVMGFNPASGAYDLDQGPITPKTRIPVPGVDIPLPQAVADQKISIANATKPPAAPPASDDTVKWIADQVQADNTGQVITKYTSGEKGLRDRVVQELKQRGVQIDTKTTATRTKAETAAPVISQADDLIEFASKPENAYIFGKIAGRWADLMAGKIGTDDPKIAAMAPKIRSLASLLAPLHGFRSANAADEFARTMPLMNSPQAFAAAVKEYKDVAQRVEDSGKAGGGTSLNDALDAAFGKPKPKGKP